MLIETTRERSELMKSIRREDTGPEQAVRKLLWRVGGRYRVNVSDLPGSPDIANKSRKKAIFVHGCFWHFHRDCDRGTIPERNRTYWKRKFRKNRERDEQKVKTLAERGFDVLVVWECELNQADKLKVRLEQFWYDGS